MKNLKIKQKVIFGIVLVVFVSIVVGLLTGTIEKQTRAKNEQVRDELTNIHYLEEGVSYHSIWIEKINDLILYDRPFDEELDYSECEFGKWIDGYLEGDYFKKAPSEYKQTILKVDEYHKELHRAAKEVIAKYKEGQRAEAKKIFDNTVEHNYQELSKSINQAETSLHQQVATQIAGINRLTREIDLFSLLGVIISMLSAAVIITILIRETIKPLSKLINKIKRMNENEEYQEIQDLHTSNEMKELIVAFNHMVSKVNSQQVRLQEQNEELMAQGEELSVQNEEIMVQQQEMQESFANLAKHEEQLNKLYEFSKLLNQTTNQEKLIQIVLEGLQEAADAQVGAFMLYNREENVLTVKYASGLLEHERLASLRLGEGLAGKAALQRKTLVASYNEGQLRSQNLQGKITMSSEIYQPLIVHDRLLGVIALGRLGNNSFSSSDQKLVDSLSDQISITLDNTYNHLQTQEALKKIQELDKLKSEMINTVSHELRTPLASILGFTELLLKKSPNEVKAKKYLATVYSEAERLKVLINDFLDLQKIENGRFEFQNTHVDLYGLLQSCIETYEGQSKDNHPITLEVQEGLPMILTDPDKISQVVGNLLSNAIKYSPNGGQIEVKALRSGLDQIRVEIRDHGLGIPEEAQRNLFKPFYRVDNSDRREIGGTGLGLAICEKIIKALGGNIWAESIHGQGSTFSFNLSLKDKKFKFKEEKAENKKMNSEVKDLILIVEDDHSLSNLLSETLNEDGYKTEVFDNGPSTLAFLERKIPQAIILDLILVGPLDGWELLHRLKMNEKTKNIPVIISSSVDQKEQGKKLGVADYLVKPFPPEKLVGSIHTVTLTAGGNVGILQFEQKPDNDIIVKQLLNDKGFNVTKIEKQKDVYVMNIEPEVSEEVGMGKA